MNSRISIDFEVFDTASIPEEWSVLVNRAKKASEGSYSPYSHFSVGAAVMTSGGHVEVGSNQENAAYPSGLCAERTVIFHTNAVYPDEAILKLAVVAQSGGHFTSSPLPPCGGCRQVLLETEKRFSHPISILMFGTEKCIVVKSAKNLLPFSFDSESLKGV